jgi:hypothetical protein
MKRIPNFFVTILTILTIMGVLFLIQSSLVARTDPFHLPAGKWSNDNWELQLLIENDKDESDYVKFLNHYGEPIFKYRSTVVMSHNLRYRVLLDHYHEPVVNSGKDKVLDQEPEVAVDRKMKKKEADGQDQRQGQISSPLPAEVQSWFLMLHKHPQMLIFNKGKNSLSIQSLPKEGKLPPPVVFQKVQ